MSFLAFFLIVLSAGLHASWNLLAKRSTMSVPFYAIICTTAMLCWVHSQFWTPIAVCKLPFRFFLLTAGSVTSDVLYCCGLVLCYRKMEMATAYPIMRSLPIILTALATTLFGWGKSLSVSAMAGFFIVFCGALMMPLSKFSDFKLKNYLTWNMVFVLIAACGTTGYTIFDSRAQRLLRSCAEGISAPVCSMTYYSTRGVMLSTALWLFVLLVPENRRALKSLYKAHHVRTAMLAGICASMTYILVLFAMNYVNNVSYVQVFRQLGLPLGMLLGVTILKERSALTKWVGVTLILLGLLISVL